MGIISSIYNSGYNIKRLFLGKQELKLAYLGEQIVFNEVIDDLNYVLYEFYKEKTISNTIEAPVKRAILKGQTLVNLVDNMLFSSSSFDAEMTYSDNTKSYFVIIESNIAIIEVGLLESHSSWNVRQSVNNLIQLKIKLTPDTTKDIFKLRCIFSNPNSTPINVKCMIIEYQEGMENWEIPYFEGIQSVKMPVLTTTGKNLFNGELEIGYIRDGRLEDRTTTVRTKDYIRVIPNELYTLSNDMGYANDNIFGYDKNYQYIQRIDDINERSENVHYIKFRSSNTNKENNLDVKYQLEIGTTATDYEPFKSNILTVNEDVTLRSKGGVYDELNLLNGRLTKRIDENNEVLAQEVVKTVDLTIVDQDEKTINKLNSFNGTTHVSTEVAENSIYPTIAIEVATE